MRLLMVVMLVLGSTACRKKAEVAPQPTETIQRAPAPPPEPPKPKPPEVVRNFQKVNFAFDSTTMVGDAGSAISANAKILQEFPNVRVEIQGHCDERGTTDYNLALGQRRAEAVKSRLVGMGIPSARLTVVSYGKERPVASGSNESSWAQNRRAEFRVLQGAEGARIGGTVN